jgi:hypothetical protein
VEPVATILFGVIQDRGGKVVVGGRDVPIDPCGPLWRLRRDQRDLFITLTRIKEGPCPL